MTDGPIGEGLAHHNAGRFADAERFYRKAIAADPDNANAWYFLGIALRQGGRPEEALGALDVALRLAPNAPEPLFNRAVAALALGRNDEAEQDLRRAIEAKPDFVEALVLFGQRLLDRGESGEAAANFAKALGLDPAHKAAAINLGLALQRAGRNDEALSAFRRAAVLAPENADVQRCLAGLLTEAGGGAEAVAASEKATLLGPRDPAAWYVLGAALESIGEFDRAATALGRAVEINPTYVDALTRLAHLDANRCDWRDGGRAARMLVELSQKTPVWPWAVAVLPSSAAEQRRAAEVWARAKTISGSARRPQRRRVTSAPLRVGYLSADFHQHATAWLVAEIFERHDRRRVEVIGYSLGPDDGSAMRRRLVSGFDRFVDLAPLNDEQAADRIAGDDIDILVDLKGWTKHARPQIPARRPAPIQVAWLGYPGTMGADWIDYALADPTVVSPALEAHFSEAVVRLPDSYQPHDSRRVVAAVTPGRTALGLPAKGFVYCCFNNVYKIAPEVFTIWMRLLSATPGSVLWLLAPHEFAWRHLRREAAARGIDPTRLVFADALAQDRHLARLPHADLFLDTLPVNAHTTASDALWMGLPLVTCLGDAFVGRVAASLLRAAGLPELVAASLSEYEAIAIRLTREPAYLAQLRSRLEGTRSQAPLFDAARLARHLEDAFDMMVERARTGLPPKSFDVPPRR